MRMKLAEALIIRAGYNQRYHELKKRILANVKTQEGMTTAEDPQELIAEFEQLMKDRCEIIIKINRTNVVTAFDKTMTLADSIAKRDGLSLHRGVLKEVAEEAIPKQDRYSKSEIRYVSTVDVNNLQKQADRLARELRELDTAIQGLNWTTDLIE
jgi:hypothetical protein